MKTIKCLLGVAALTGALAVSGNANTIVDLGFDTSVSNQNSTTVLSAANAFGVDSGVPPDDADLISGGRITGSSGGTLTNFAGTFTLSVDSNNVGTLTFTMNSGFVLAGIGVHGGGGSVEHFFSVNDETAGIAEGPFTADQNKKGINQGFSNFDIFVENDTGGTTTGQSAPDGGTTVMLLGGALTGLGVMRRYLKR